MQRFTFHDARGGEAMRNEKTIFTPSIPPCSEEGRRGAARLSLAPRLPCGTVLRHSHPWPPAIRELDVRGLKGALYREPRPPPSDAAQQVIEHGRPDLRQRRAS